MSLSPRYATHTVVLLAVAVIPTLFHNYATLDERDGLAASAVTPVLAGMTSTATARKPAQVKNRFDSDDWLERVYGTGPDGVTLFVGRSYDAKRLYHHPEIALGVASEPAGIARAAAHPEIPLHVLTREKNGQTGLVVYALLYEDRFVEEPFAFQLRTSLESLVKGRRLMTLFFASDLAGQTDIDRAPATRVLLAAIDAFRAQQPSAQPPAAQ